MLTRFSRKESGYNVNIYAESSEAAEVQKNARGEQKSLTFEFFRRDTDYLDV